MSIMCPHCGSNRTQTCAMASVQGTSDTVMYGLGTNFHGGWGGAIAAGTSQSRFAAANTPKYRPTLPYAAAAGMIVVAALFSGPTWNAWMSGTGPALGWFLLATLAWVMVPLVVIRQKRARRAWDAGMESYARMWVCQACGVSWTV